MYQLSISYHYKALDVFKHFLAKVETQLEHRVKTLLTNHDQEYLSHIFEDFCEEKGLQRLLIIPGTPQQNGVAERKN